MAKHLISGKYGEEVAVNYLQNLGYDVFCVNWRYKYYEIDILAKEGNILVFIEVKTRTRSDFGNPATFVDVKKQKHLINAADAYIEQTNYQGEIRFDIVEVYLLDNKIEIIKDAFWSN